LSAEQISRLPLLQQSTRPHASRQWFESGAMRLEHDLNGTLLALFSMLAPAPMHGMGVALIPPFLIRSELQSGRLVTANHHSVDRRNAYYRVIPERKAESATLQGFRDWVIAEAQQYRAVPAAAMHQQAEYPIYSHPGA